MESPGEQAHQSMYIAVESVYYQYSCMLTADGPAPVDQLQLLLDDLDRICKKSTENVNAFLYGTDVHEDIVRLCNQIVPKIDSLHEDHRLHKLENATEREIWSQIQAVEEEFQDILEGQMHSDQPILHQASRNRMTTRLTEIQQSNNLTLLKAYPSRAAGDRITHRLNDLLLRIDWAMQNMVDAVAAHRKCRAPDPTPAQPPLFAD